MQSLLARYPERGQQTRLRIIEATIDSIVEDGFDAVTFEKVGERAGMGKANVRYHFQSKAELFRSVVQFVVAAAQTVTEDELSQASGAHERLTALLRAPFMWVESFPQHGSLWLLFWHLCSREEDYRAMNHDARLRGAQRIVEVLGEFPEAEGLSVGRMRSLGQAIQRILIVETEEVLTCNYEESLAQKLERVAGQIRKLLASEGIQFDPAI